MGVTKVGDFDIEHETAATAAFFAQSRWATEQRRSQALPQRERLWYGYVPSDGSSISV